MGFLVDTILVLTVLYFVSPTIRTDMSNTFGDLRTKFSNKKDQEEN